MGGRIDCKSYIEFNGCLSLSILIALVGMNTGDYTRDKVVFVSS